MFEDNSFDCYTIAFGIRNVVKIDAALREARRVLKPGGRFLCLEFSKVITKSRLNYIYFCLRQELNKELQFLFILNFDSQKFEQYFE